MNKNIEEIDKLLKRHFKKSENSIMQIGIMKNSEISKYSFKGNDVEEISLFGLGSISKTIISTYLCKLVREGKIDLNKRVNHYIGLNARITYPTILELATHTSGYHAFIPLLPSLSKLLFNGFNKKNFYLNINEQWLKKSLYRIRPFRRKKYRYSDYNYAVIAYLIEIIEKKPYKEIILEFVRNEIGMNNTVYGDEKLSKNDKYTWYWENDNPYLASGGMFSTIDDMLKFLNYQINHQEELELSLMKYHKTNFNKSVYTGFSWNAFYKSNFYWHIGGQGYYRSYALFDTKRKISIIILSTVEIDLLHIGRIGSSLYRNIKRNDSLAKEYLDLFEL